MNSLLWIIWLTETFFILIVQFRYGFLVDVQPNLLEAYLCIDVIKNIRKHLHTLRYRALV